MGPNRTTPSAVARRRVAAFSPTSTGEAGRPRLDPLRDVLGIFAGRVLDELLAVGAYHPDQPVVKVDVVIVIDHTHVIGPVGVGVRLDHFNITGITQDYILKDLY